MSFLRDDVDMRIALDAGEYRSYVGFFDRLPHRDAQERRHR